MGAFSTEVMTRNQVVDMIIRLIDDADNEALCDALSSLRPGSYQIGTENQSWSEPKSEFDFIVTKANERTVLWDLEKSLDTKIWMK